MRRGTRLKCQAFLFCEEFEPRVVPSSPSSSPTAAGAGAGFTVALDPSLDESGQQVVTNQSYIDSIRSGYAIFDTGSPVVSFSAKDQANFTALGDPIPVKVPGGAEADLLGGAVIGDVSQPGVVFVAGLGVGSSSGGSAGAGGSGSAGFRTETATVEPPCGGTGTNGNGSPVPPRPTPPSGIQVLIGTAKGSPNLPTLAGTPILEPSSQHPHGVAALVTLGGAAPALALVNSGTSLLLGPGGAAIVQVPMTLSGPDNHGAPGAAVTTAPVPVQTGVQLVEDGVHVGQQRFLFDTGSQITAISSAEARALGLNLSSPGGSIKVGGVDGTQSVPTFTLSELDLPLVGGGTLRFTNVTVAVLDLADGFDGVLGMNLMSQASEFLYDPYGSGGATLSISFLPKRLASGPGSSGNQGTTVNPTLTGTVGTVQLPGLEFNNAQISGHVFLDFNANGVQDPGEAGVAGVQLFLDLTGDGKLDPGDPTAVTDSTGAFAFTNLASGAYTVRQELPSQLIAVDAAGGQSVSAQVNVTTRADFADQPRVQSADQAFVTELYGALLDRAPDSVGLTAWVNVLESGTPRSVVVSKIWQSPEHRGLEVQSYYQDFFHRSADAAGLKYWVGRLLAGQSETDVETGMLLSGEYQAAHVSNTAFISGLYLDVLGRMPTAAGLTAWISAMNSGETRAQVIRQVLTSTEEYRLLLDQYYANFLHRSVNASGQGTWLGLLQGGKLAPADVAVALLDSSEFFAWARQVQQV